MQEYALDGLQQVMAIKSQAVLPYLVPKLIHPPVNTKALSLLASVAGQALDRELYKILQVKPLNIILLVNSQIILFNGGDQKFYCTNIQYDGLCLY